MSDTTDHPRVGFIGLGSQGGPMARKIIEAGYPVTLWARRPAALEPFAGTAAKTAGSPAALAAASDLVCVCVLADADTEEVVDAVLVGLAAGSVIAVHSTVLPDTCRRLAARAAAGGIRLIDAPVSGGGPAAEAGRLLVMAGGDEATVDFCRPVFATFANPVVYLGPVGSGQVAKLLNNAAFTAHLGIAASLFTLARSLGVDPLRLADVISHGSGNSFALERVASAGATLDRIAGHAGLLLRKDVGLVNDLAASADAPTGTLLAAANDALALMNVTPAVVHGCAARSFGAILVSSGWPRGEGIRMSEEVALAAAAAPIAMAAIGLYGRAVLAKAWDDVADVTIKSGLRLLQRIFGRRQDGEALPDVVAEVIEYPDDDDVVVQLRLAIRRALKADPSLANEVAAIVAEAAPGGPVTQHVVAGRDAYAAGRDMTVNRRPR